MTGVAGAAARTVVTRSPDETRAVGRALGETLFPGALVALIGGLGSGKTVLVQGIADALGAGAAVSSPSFVIVNEYRGRVPVFHVDLYRIDDAQALVDLGYRELFYGEGVALVEWADRVPELLPADRLSVALAFAGPSDRRMMIEATGPAHAAALAQVAFPAFSPFPPSPRDPGEGP